MSENISFNNLNEHRRYPFKELDTSRKKPLPISDFFLRVPPDTVTCYISSVTSDNIIISLIGADEEPYEYAETHNGLLTNQPMSLYKIDLNLDEPIGFALAYKRLNFPLIFTASDTELLETTYIKDSPDRVRSIYVRDIEGNLIRLKPNIVFRAGENMQIDTDPGQNKITFSALTVPSIGQRIRAIKINDDQIKGHNLTFYGRNIIRVAGADFDTAITDPTLKCPIVFEAGLKGDKGDQGPAGLGGVPGSGYIIDCGTKDFCDPCDQDCGEFDSLCEVPPFPPIIIPPNPDIEEPPELECPVDIDFPEPEFGAGGGLECEIYPIEVLEDLDVGPTAATFIKGLYTSGYPDALAGPLTEDYTWFILHQGAFDPGTDNPVNLPNDHAYVYKFHNIDIQYVDDLTVDQLSFYFYHGFRLPATDGALAFNGPSSWADGVFQYCVDENCKRVFFYETIKEDFTGEWAHGWWSDDSPDPETAAGVQSDNKEVYALWEDGTRAKIIDVANEKTDHLIGNVAKVTIYDTNAGLQYPDLQVFLHKESPEEIPKLTVFGGPLGPIYQVAHPLAYFGLAAMSGISVKRTPNYDWDGSTKEQANITGAYAWNVPPAKDSYYHPYCRRRSWYKDIDIPSSVFKLYDRALETETVDYLDTLDLVKSMAVLQVQAPPEDGVPPVVVTEYSFFKQYGYYGTYRMSDCIALFAFMKEIVLTTEGTPIEIDRTHQVAVTNNNIDGDNHPPNIYEFEIWQLPDNDMDWYKLANGYWVLWYYERYDRGEDEFRLHAFRIWGHTIDKKDYTDAADKNFIARIYKGYSSPEETWQEVGYHMLKQDQEWVNPNLDIHYNHDIYFDGYIRVPITGEAADMHWEGGPLYEAEEVLEEGARKYEVESLSPALVTPGIMDAAYHPHIFQKSYDVEYTTTLHYYYNATSNWDSFWNDGKQLGFNWTYWRYEYHYWWYGARAPFTISTASGPQTLTVGSYYWAEGWGVKPNWVALAQALGAGPPPGGYRRWYLQPYNSGPGSGWTGAEVFLGPTTMNDPTGNFVLHKMDEVPPLSGNYVWVSYPAYYITIDPVRAPSTGFDYVKYRGHHQESGVSLWGSNKLASGFYMDADTFLIEGYIYNIDTGWTYHGWATTTAPYIHATTPDYANGGQIELHYTRSNFIMEPGDPPMNPATKYGFKPEWYSDIVTDSKGRTHQRWGKFYVARGHIIDEPNYFWV